MNIPEIIKEENEEKRAQSIIERAVVASATQGPMQQRLARGGTPPAPAPSRNGEGEEFFTFGNSLADGVSLAPG